MRPSLWFPVKPWIISQSWGIYNPAYLQFGFSKHNGVDVLTGERNEVRSPDKLVVFETGFNESAGNYVRLFSDKKYQIGDQECFYGLMVMHLEKHSCVKGQVLEVGELIGIADSTGFSTGPHTHFTFRRYSKQKWDKKYQLDTDKETDYTFDPSPYWNRYYAVDKGKVINILASLIKLLQALHGSKIKGV